MTSRCPSPDSSVPWTEEQLKGCSMELLLRRVQSLWDREGQQLAIPETQEEVLAWILLAQERLLAQKANPSVVTQVADVPAAADRAERHVTTVTGPSHCVLLSSANSVDPTLLPRHPRPTSFFKQAFAQPSSPTFARQGQAGPAHAASWRSRNASTPGIFGTS